MNKLILAFGLGIAAAVVWRTIHSRCPACQARWAALRRTLALRWME